MAPRKKSKKSGARKAVSKVKKTAKKVAKRTGGALKKAAGRAKKASPRKAASKAKKVTKTVAKRVGSTAKKALSNTKKAAKTARTVGRAAQEIGAMVEAGGIALGNVTERVESGARAVRRPRNKT